MQDLYVHQGLLFLYGVCFFGTLLDLSMTRAGLLLGAVEANGGMRWLFAVFGFDSIVFFRFAVFGVLVVVSEFLFRRLAASKVGSSDWVKTGKMVLLCGWIAKEK